MKVQLAAAHGLRYAPPVRLMTLVKGEIMRRNSKAEWELWSSVRLLAHWTENIRFRLSNAYEYHLCYVDGNDMPTEELKKKLNNAKSKLTKNHTKSVEESIHKWRLATCRAVAEDICQIYYDFTHFEWHLHPEKTLFESLVETTGGAEK